MNGLIRWFSTNHVAANLLMVTIVAAGLMSAANIKQEVFPEITMDMVTVSVPYLGATPAEVEEAVCIRVEEAVQGVDGIKKITSAATEGLGIVTIELDRGTDRRKALDDVKAEVDRIVTFPAETEKPIVTLVEPRQQVIDVVIHGDVPERTLKLLADKVRDDLLTDPDITYVSIAGTRPFEISIEVAERDLQAYGLTLDEVMRAVQANSLDLPGGSVKTEGGEILVRTRGQRYTGQEFGRIVVITAPDGTEVTLDRIARVRDGFEDVDTASFLDGDRSAIIQVYRTGEQGVLRVTDAAKDYVAAARDGLPPGIGITTFNDRSIIYKSRMDLLLRNGVAGLVLVFLCLALTLQFRLALWVSLGIAISFLGAFWTVPLFGVSLNMISMFAFIVSLGIVVDDAIVVGENVHSWRERGRSPQAAATLGTREVAVPVTLAVLTTVVAFLPLAFVEGTMGKFMFNVPVVVISILMFSLVESLLILPAHLATMKSMGEQEADRAARWYGRLKDRVDAGLKGLVERAYRPSLGFALVHRPVAVAVALATLLVTFGFVAGGHVEFTFMPKVDADNLVAALTLPQGTTIEDAEQAVAQLEASLEQVRREFDARRDPQAPSVITHVATSVGSQPRSSQVRPMDGAGGGGGGAHLVEVNAELLKAEFRDVPSPDLARRWRELCGPVTGAVSLTFSANLFQGGSPVSVQLSSPDTGALLQAARELKEQLGGFPGVIDISDSFREGKVEMQLGLRPEARTLGITLADLARQVRAGFYGAEAMRIQRGRDEVKVMVRYPEDERRSLGNIESMRIRTPGGDEVPFGRVATVDIGRGFATIERADRQRVVAVTADVDQDLANADAINALLRGEILPRLVAAHPGLRWSMEGEQRQQAESLGSLKRGFVLAILLIFVILAVQFRSYSQPVIIMTAIPFGLVGAIWGHILMGIDLTLISMFGVVALTGVVVNDSLIMIDFINRARREGVGMRAAVIDSGVRRFRPIMLTSLTTFAGLTPLLLEKSLQARFLVPMAVSLGFGVVFSTFITLILIPVSYTLLSDLKVRLGMGDRMEEPEEVF
ncbi:MAG: efflux RND transporter permease subunit [Krumholzibacteria bacterium]|nr:efflux RND transporter permease subunit [Candidatus Krumholzibacteria bacterium]